MKLDHLALDIETIPARPLAEYSESAQATITRKIARAAESDPEMTYEKFAALSADLGRIICISVGFIKDGRVRLKSFCSDDEMSVLDGFNALIADFPGTFLHFNGLQFDIPYILRRMAHNGIRPSNPRLANLRRFQTDPHLDLMCVYYNWDARSVLPLGLLAELYNLPTPKNDLSGDKVYGAYLAGEWERIKRYCEFDVATVLNLWRRAIRFEEFAGCDLYDGLDAADPKNDAGSASPLSRDGQLSRVEPVALIDHEQVDAAGEGG